MGFNGGGGGALPAHEHTNIANDGGPLDFVNTTIGSLSAGSMTYSDGAALQELTIGAGATILTSSAGVPTWTAAGGALTTNSLEDHLTANFTTNSVSAVSTGLSLTLTNSAGGIAIIQCSGAVVSGNTNVDNIYEIFDDGVLANNAATNVCNNQSVAANRKAITVNWSMPTDGSVITLMTRVSSSSITIIGTNPPTAAMIISEIY